jgi:hypothetical protein
MRFKKIDIQPDDRIHMTDEPRLKFTNSLAEEGGQGVGKPRGLWYAMGRSWMEWIEQERMPWWKKYIYKIELNPERILFIDKPSKVYSLQKEFGNPGKYTIGIDWKRVAEKYSGIEWNPYFYNLRLTQGIAMYYYSLDVPSGCIWDKAGIKSITRLN